MKRCTESCETCETCDHYTAIGRYYEDGYGGEDFIPTGEGRCWEEDEIVRGDSAPCGKWLGRA